MDSTVSHEQTERLSTLYDSLVDCLNFSHELDADEKMSVVTKLLVGFAIHRGMKLEQLIKGVLIIYDFERDLEDITKH